MSRRTWLAALAAPALLLALIPGGTASPAAAAGSGTIVFIKGHNVWIANGDGSGQRPVTSDGTYESPYRTPSMSDAGIIAASHDTRIFRMTQHGQVLNTMDPPALKNTVGHFVDGVPVDVAISPNGALIAYTFVGYEAGMARFASAYTAADRLTPAAQYQQTYFRSPSWIGNGRTLQTGGYGSQVMIHDLGGEPFHWWDDSDWAENDTDLSNSELSPDGKWVAATRGYAEDSHILTAQVTGNAQSGGKPPVPDYSCVFGINEALTLDDPTWAPDSSRLAWTEPSQGIYVTADAHDCGDPYLLIPGGSEADWSPAALSPAVVVKPGPSPDKPSHKALHATKKPTIAGTAKAGKKLTAKPGSWSPRPSSYTYRWYRNGAPIKGATKRTYTVKKSDRGRKITVRIQAKRAGYPAGSAVSRSVKIKR